jgi:hypothetical protein
MKSVFTMLAASLALAASGSALAHGVQVPQYGGVVTKVNDVTYELVATPDSIAVFVDDHGQKVDVSAARAKVMLIVKGVKTSVTLLPAGGNKLEGKGSFKLAPGAKAVSVVTFTGKPGATARYVLK